MGKPEGYRGNGLVGNIPALMELSLRNTCCLGLDNYKLEGTEPEEFGLLESVRELNLENNNLSGKVPFSAKFVAKTGDKLLEGNPNLCNDEELSSCAKVGSSLGQLKLCSKPYYILKSAIQHGEYQDQSSSVSHLLMLIGFVFLLSL